MEEVMDYIMDCLYEVGFLITIAVVPAVALIILARYVYVPVLENFFAK